MASLNALLVVGTDTEVGKTVVTSALLAYWQRYRPT
jgi:dethiobiotin synthetase